ncbi:flagellar hook-length control protein FliK [Caldanaerobacter subterraneus subsp. tengcongensis MB4]|uniref:Flagellar hook-length control protein-like C-terminal domain-containing protein n=1 Tax=Caldanaerobacter subterraneus subsp. tengcongensis (strain DSM 15242 / JCM 11007 / NBRC 100824 / MB4) TaxID=273068 RepID=Q8R9Z4_CALS4|nr:flagellar hook-length control protein FliK [Caldanaerobacter subterraneus]AAM24658.1 hypothetical protein TTE1436 [Caldanaerobacter subterraneus subsp. tengcongensis MB4]MBE3579240.1 flagellar hook-length control protein FliK [Caldanaerobacter subterraneus]MCS3915780.1 flagellar hook-length control protein FliK [Caldanaerobacter subterraneus subsp. tengcongensis MB4]
MSEQVVVQELLPFLKAVDSKMAKGGENGKEKVSFLDLLLSELTETREGNIKENPLNLKKEEFLSQKNGLKNVEIFQEKVKEDKDIMEDLNNFIPALMQTITLSLETISSEKGASDFEKVREKLEVALQGFIKERNFTFKEIAKKISDFLKENFNIELSPEVIERHIKLAKVKDLDKPFLQDLNQKDFAEENVQKNQDKTSQLKIDKEAFIAAKEAKEEKTEKKSFDVKQEFVFFKNEGKPVSNLTYNSIKKSNDPVDRLFRQIVDNVFVAKEKGASSVTVNLKPEILGKLQISLKSIDGNIVATIVTESEKTKHQIESNLSLLQAQLDLKGIKIESVNVAVDKNFQFTPQYTGEGNYQGSFYGENENLRYFHHYGSKKYLPSEELDLTSQNYYFKDGHLDLMA